ncbi:MAG: hypothetical protein EAZ16_03490 [Sphingobacteriales bacterium]|nr:MAG: hypothetical protein EAZ16_03490 [Sphingobacteriales bacterium]
MNSTYTKLFKVQVEHLYFDDLQFNGCKFSPSATSSALFIKHGFVIKKQADGFIVFFVNPFEGNNRIRETVLKNMFRLQFFMHLTEPSFYNHTANLPNNFSNQYFSLNNFDDDVRQIIRNSNLLHQSEFVTETEIKQQTDSSNYFGSIEIQFDLALKEDFYIRFLNKKIHWRYIIVNTDVLQLEKLAILDSANKNVFSAPELVTLPNGVKGWAFTSNQPIANTQRKYPTFQLVTNYNETTNTFEKKILHSLPIPSQFNALNQYEFFVYL